VQVLKVTGAPVPKKEYHTPPAVLSVVVQGERAPVVVEFTVVPFTATPHVSGIALPHRSLAGGGGATQVLQVTVVVRHVFWVPHALLVLICSLTVPENVAVHVIGVVPEASTGVELVPSVSTSQSVAILEVKV
jgi:hypothetical protein